MTLSSLSMRNAKRQARDYLVYFVTMVMTAALMYSFNGLVFSQEMLNLGKMMEVLPMVVTIASIVVVCIIAWLVQYTTNFMLSRRSRELGTYILIGLENKQVAKMFFRENLIVGGAALIPGLLLGNLLYQGLRALVLSLFGKPFSFTLGFSPKALALTLCYFLLIYLMAQRKSRKRIRSMKIYDLIYFERKNEEAVIQKSSNRKKLSIISIVLGVIGTLLIMAGDLTLGLIGAGLIIAFLYGFFASFASSVPAYFEKHSEKKYQGQTLIVFRSLSAKLAAMGVVMATIALLFTATQISEGAGLIFRAMFESRYEQNSCFDLMISSGTPQEEAMAKGVEFAKERISEEYSREYNIYFREETQNTDVIGSYIAKKGDYYRYYKMDTLMKFSDYAALRKLLGYSEVTLEPGKYLIHCQPYIARILKDWSQTVEAGGSSLEFGGIYTERFAQYLWCVNGHGYILIVPDEIAEASVFSHRVYAAKTPEPMDGFYGELKEQISAVLRAKDYEDHNVDLFLYSRAEDEKETASEIATIVFPLYYLALALTMTAATILTIQQLSEADRYRRQFNLLQKLGMDREDMEKALRKQFAFFYTLPALPSLLISIPFLLNMCGAADSGSLVGASHPLILLGITFALFFFIYAIYIFMAYSTMKRNVLP